jgi:hypothetical protein
MFYKTIDVHAGSQLEAWLKVYPDGRIVLHTENDGPAYMRHPRRRGERPIDLVELLRLDARFPGKRLLEQVADVLTDRRQP